MLESVVVEPRGAHRASIIWLHGLGADGHDFQPVVPELGLPADAGVRFIFPHAPVRPVTLNNGMAMRAWYDIASLDVSAREDAEGIEASRSEVETLIAAEREAGIPAGAIVLAGFSQGGAIALHAALRHPERLAGVMGLSTYLPLRDRLAGEVSGANRDLPVFMAHGSLDPMLPQQLGEMSRDHLQAAGYTVAWHSYPMQHQVCLEEIRTIGAWLRGVLSIAGN
ncbi:alpha/beta hydrolase [Spectribacter hydrogenooxidans]|uniref:Alpha/beta hydrolase-fold protein n=1 Tax=Spectribacter hydrogenoxidans TaxID=3075608 RepID=A0ABU3BW89_9GAMM|nr:alpha/beta fold hydrolase [Salinisphaera sp. W335]MDT0633544.1 alpha/beta hydrolase-fold protein [Salinisphaera sp. W335]